MRDPVAATYRKTGAATAEVGIHPRAGEGGRPLDQITTSVQLHRYTNGWVATGAKAVNAIEVDDPLPFSRILSPVPVSGLSVAYEGTVHVTVTEDRRGADRVLGKTFVNGGADTLAPFRGQVRFTRPTGDAGWVVFTPDSGADLGIFTATAVRVRFVNLCDQRPRSSASPPTRRRPPRAKLVTLTGSGTFTVALKAIDVDEVRLLLVPCGTGGRPHAKLLGVDREQRRTARTGRSPGASRTSRSTATCSSRPAAGAARSSTTGSPCTTPEHHRDPRGEPPRLPSLLPLDMSERPLIGFGR